MRGILLVCLAAGLWGTVGVATALMTTRSGADPAVFGLIRTALGGLCLLAAARLLRLPRPGLRQVPLGALAVFGLAGAAFQICLFGAFREVGVTVTVAVTVCAPVLIVIAVDAARTRTAPRRAVLLAVTTGMAGVALALPEADRAPAATADLRGMALLVGASGAFAAIALVTRTIAGRVDPLRGAGLGLMASALALAAFLGLRTGGAAVGALAALPLRDLAILLYVGVIATGVAYLAFVLGMHLCSSASAGLAATMVEPGIAAVLAALVLHERLTPPEVGGCALMLLAMLILSRIERRKAGLTPAAP
ncbi:DMT family transporter [Rubellimicrobium roseum]|uniref:DMT family transporter n=1 Tax=Rubellimicrobium roseum TaxID=687525 RepID=A0A5C4NL86_9RHOB|nr:DMT family transporter [Rubellimicrobium roseum]TNC74655.1 DMT family transporter [Rubellimicrobium roseum]